MQSVEQLCSYTISTDSVLAVPLRELSYLYELGDYIQENGLCHTESVRYARHLSFVN